VRLLVELTALLFSDKVDDTVVTFSGKVDGIEVAAVGFLFGRRC